MSEPIWTIMWHRHPGRQFDSKFVKLRSVSLTFLIRQFRISQTVYHYTGCEVNMYFQMNCGMYRKDSNFTIVWVILCLLKHLKLT